MLLTYFPSRVKIPKTAKSSQLILPLNPIYFIRQANNNNIPYQLVNVVGTIILENVRIDLEKGFGCFFLIIDGLSELSFLKFHTSTLTEIWQIVRCFKGRKSL